MRTSTEKRCCCFLRQLKGEIGAPWTIVWDRNQIHSPSRVVRHWLAKHLEVVGEDFPAHAPDTYADESVWCWTKYGQLCNLAPPISRNCVVISGMRWWP